MNTPAKTYPCPQCGVPNGGTELQVHRGLKCSGCGLGYIPVKIETRSREPQESPAALWIVLIVVVALILIFLPIWLVLWVVPVLLLAGILVAVLRSKK